MLAMQFYVASKKEANPLESVNRLGAIRFSLSAGYKLNACWHSKRNLLAMQVQLSVSRKKRFRMRNRSINDQVGLMFRQR